MEGRDEELDIGIIGNRIARIGRGLKAAHARVLVEAEGYQVTPALAEGAPANLALIDAGRTIMTVRNGRILTDDLGLSIADVSRAGAVQQFQVEPWLWSSYQREWMITPIFRLG